MLPIYQVIKRERKRRKMTQAVLAQKSGLSQTYLSQLEKGDRNISLLVLEQIAKGLGMTLGTFLMGAMDKKDLKGFVNNLLIYQYKPA